MLKMDSQALPYLFNEEVYLIQERPKITHFDYLGENKQGILFIVQNVNGNQNVSNEYKELIIKILSNIKLKMNDIALLNIASNPTVSFDDLKKFFNPQKIVCFGVQSIQLGIQDTIPENVIYSIENIKLLFTRSLAELTNNQEAKLAWWSAMKSIF